MRPSVCEIVKNQDVIAEVCHPFVDRRKLKGVRPVVVSEVGALSPDQQAGGDYEFILLWIVLSQLQ
ncbi:hypothetical protein BBP07_18870 [Citrobacter koseri]|nr:hypothetical protein BBP07_18870 [Citrobacter koseri]